MRLLKLSIVSIFMIAFSYIPASQSSHCEDLSKLACDSKIKPDGTGFSRNPDTAQDNDNFYKKCFPHTADAPTIRSILLGALRDKESAKGCKPDSKSLTCEKFFDNLLIVIFRCAQESLGCKNKQILFDDSKLVHPLLFLLNFQFAGNWRTEKQKISVENSAVHERDKAKTFPKIKELIIQKVQSLDIDASKKRIMIERLRQVTLGSTNCRSNLPAFEPNAYFDPFKATVHHCDSAFRYSTSDFAAAFTLAHEIAHAIDPCTIMRDTIRPYINSERTNPQDTDKLYPLKNVVTCMRSKDSVAAKNLKCPGDQSSEAMCDWFASEVLTDYIQAEYPNLTKQQWINGAANVWSMFCPISNSTTSEGPHPKSMRRINNLFLAQPEIRRKIGCPAQPKQAKYCTAPTLSATNTSPQRTGGAK